MATLRQKNITLEGGGERRLTYKMTLTMAAGATVNQTFTPPTGAWVSGIRYHVATSFTGTPTNINLAVGKTDGAQDYVANVDVKTAAAPANATLVNLADYDSWPSAQGLHVSLTAVAGTNPAGTCYVYIDYAAPNF